MATERIETTSEPDEATRKDKGAKVTGVVLIALGLVFLAGQLLDLGVGMLPLLAAGFLAAGVATRQPGWFVPAGILGGIGLGAVLTDSGVAVGPGEGGVFLLSFALGWLTIDPLSRLFARTPQPWAYIPAGIMALIGGAVLLGERGERALEQFFALLNIAWPLALVAAGAALLWRHRHAE